jgi:hypothetical protein
MQSLRHEVNSLIHAMRGDPTDTGAEAANPGQCEEVEHSVSVFSDPPKHPHATPHGEAEDDNFQTVEYVYNNGHTLTSSLYTGS